MQYLILGVGNLLVRDEGFGVHFIRHLESHYQFPDEVELFDAGTLGLMAIHKLEEADRVYIVDILDAEGEPGELRRYAKKDLLLKRIPVKLSPHQVGVQEMLMVSEMRGCCPEEIHLLGVIPAALESGVELTPPLQERLVLLAEELVAELRSRGIEITPAATGGGGK